MAGYFGTKIQQRLQAQAEASEGFIAATPGACQAGRTMGCDDPQEFGWERITEIIDRDGVFGFRLIDTSDAEAIRSELANRGFRFDNWEVFLADRETALGASRGLANCSLPRSYSFLPTPTDPESQQMKELQSMMADADVVPFSGSMLSGAIGNSTTILIGDAHGNVAASAHGYMPHNIHSPFHRYAWGGLVAVAEAHRGRGLGKTVNAIMIDHVFRNLGASHIYELISASNIPSRRMLEACGLRLEPTLTCGIATPYESRRFTK
jgi:RimJ/RimL family protein N-acetyltransferase